MLVTNFDAPTGGIQKNTRLLLREFGLRGLKAYVCARNYENRAKDEVTDGVTIHRSRVVGGSLAVNGVLYLLDAFVWLVRNRRLYDVVHCQQMHGPTMAATLASLFTRKPIVTRVTLSGGPGEANAVREMPLASVRLRLIRRVTRWVALTREMKSEIETLGISPERIEIIYNSTEIPEAAAFRPADRKAMREKLGLRGERYACFLGRLSEEKNLDVLLDAWAGIVERQADAHLLLLGAGGDFRNVERELREQTSRLGLDGSVHFLGHVDNAKEYVLASDAFILPTRTEGMSNALVEAFACGTAIVATDIAANRELCVDGENSLLVPVGDQEKLADAIDAIFADAALAERLGAAARQLAEDKLTVETMVSKYLSLYAEAIDETPA